ncbi:hypothetical protein E3P96_03776 [Wallemia ichthyophaga]|nr:hypothetical protein E3P96_03776 [Wallemia ichthyophaga]
MTLVCVGLFVVVFHNSTPTDYILRLMRLLMLYGGWVDRNVDSLTNIKTGANIHEFNDDNKKSTQVEFEIEEESMVMQNMRNDPHIWEVAKASNFKKVKP